VTHIDAYMVALIHVEGTYVAIDAVCQDPLTAELIWVSPASGVAVADGKRVNFLYVVVISAGENMNLNIFAMRQKLLTAALVRSSLVSVGVVGAGVAVAVVISAGENMSLSVDTVRQNPLTAELVRTSLAYVGVVAAVGDVITSDYENMNLNVDAVR